MKEYLLQFKFDHLLEWFSTDTEYHHIYLKNDCKIKQIFYFVIVVNQKKRRKKQIAKIL